MTQLPTPSIEAVSPQPLQALLDPTIDQGHFSNLAGVRSTPHEFILDFMVQFGPEVHIVSRIVMTPDHTRRLIEILTHNYAAWQESNQPRNSTAANALPKAPRRSKGVRNGKPSPPMAKRTRK
jgi:hypothetical protein